MAVRIIGSQIDVVMMNKDKMTTLGKPTAFLRAGSSVVLNRAAAQQERSRAVFIE